MLKRKKRDVWERFIINFLSLLMETSYYIIDLYGVPVKDHVGYEAQTASFIHDLLVIAGAELPLVI